jgi:hypothetical protein
VVGATGQALAFVRGGDAGGDPVLVVVNAGEKATEVPGFAPELGGATLVDVPLPGSEGLAAVTLEADGRVLVPVAPRTGRILVRP